MSTFNISKTASRLLSVVIRVPFRISDCVISHASDRRVGYACDRRSGMKLGKASAVKSETYDFMGASRRARIFDWQV